MLVKGGPADFKSIAWLITDVPPMQGARALAAMLFDQVITEYSGFDTKGINIHCIIMNIFYGFIVKVIKISIIQMYFQGIFQRFHGAMGHDLY